MSEILIKLAACEQITEWVVPADKRILRATNQPRPSGGMGGMLRKEWSADKSEWPLLEEQVKRLIVPIAIGKRAIAEMDGDEDWNRLRLTVSNRKVWNECFPAGSKTEIFKTEEGQQAWAAVALCGNILGLAVFAQETSGTTIQARIQPVPEEIFQRII